MENPASTPKVVPDVSFLAELISSDSRALLDTIDGLKKIQVGDDKVNLPKVIVVGNRSSGKSSVLEAITGIQFPIDRALCTRFATELILRRADEIAVNVSIQYAERPPSGAQGGGGAREPFHKATFDEDALPNIIREAKERMGICDNGTQKFSRDVLLIEVARPDVYPLTLVDLPGISHSTAADQSLEDQSIVNQLIESYMKKPNCIILAVVAANDHLVDQKVLQEARKHDPKWERTIGVITKPDLPCSHEREYLDLANGRNNMHSGTLGWHVLRNMSGQERSSGDEDRDTIEERFFKSGTWSSINPANRGVKSLRRTLSKAILGQIKTCLPKLIQDIKNKLKIRQEDLARLGKARSGTEEQRSYLLGIADEYQRLARDAIEGRYRANPGFFGGIGQTATKLRAELRNRNRAFHVIMETNGGRFRILREGGDYASTELAEPNDELPGHLRQLIKEYSIRDPEPKDESTLKADLQSQACFSRGGELPGEAVEELALQLFREQIEPWHDITWMHLRETLKVVQAFVHRAFIHVIGADEQVEEAILTRYVDPFFDKKEEDLRCKLEELLLPYSSGYGPLLEAEFILGMRSMAERRRLQHDRPKRLQQQSCGVEFSQGECLSEDRPLAFRDLEDPERNECCTEKAIDWMTVYYEMSLRTFTDNIINLAVEGCLVRDIPTILTPRDVCGMAPETLEALASESQESRSQRQWLEREVRILQEGLRECQRHERRSLPS
ncbi:P-loop containing nucleoside triphosphate hydrolase protein [Chaetomium strumarium]|uniref:P-loop containing nucleoside triphosphate hydrolase protein n=1 Tax=Chaetomium strumarium TaxID=1170767 RepID=A0AAJ0GN73_9PEZI|nr:P-loop containing nucleoside triphosphate hydrolase protein [Chaetomium strumarium]